MVAEIPHSDQQGRNSRDLLDAISAAKDVPMSAPNTMMKAVAALMAPYAANVAEIMALVALL